MIVKLLFYAMEPIMGIFMLPYLLSLAWERILSFKRVGKPSDFELVASKCGNK